jgi:hypothetical protein
MRCVMFALTVVGVLRCAQPRLVYTGIYRFLNNPDCVTGYAGLYGLALISQSWLLFSIAVGSQTANLIFVYLVEIPHMERLYSVRLPRISASAPRARRLTPGWLTLIGDACRDACGRRARCGLAWATNYARCCRRR